MSERFRRQFKKGIAIILFITISALLITFGVNRERQHYEQLDNDYGFEVLNVESFNRIDELHGVIINVENELDYESNRISRVKEPEYDLIYKIDYSESIREEQINNELRMYIEYIENYEKVTDRVEAAGNAIFIIVAIGFGMLFIYIWLNKEPS